MSVIKTSVTQLKQLVELFDLHKPKPADERILVKVKEMIAKDLASPHSDSELIFDNRLSADVLSSAALSVRLTKPPSELLSMRTSSLAPPAHPLASAPPYIESLLRDLVSSNNINQQPIVVAPNPHGAGVIATSSNDIDQRLATFREPHFWS